MTATDPSALTAAEFAGLMAGFEPFEPAPVIAVATSGGADSLALVLLAHGWARVRAGRVVALTVDHGLRPESEAEARAVTGWLAGVGVEHVVLRWRAAKPASGVQAAARAARYALLESWCVTAGVLHLLLGHQIDDQAETYLMRRRRRAAGPGLAAMAPLVERRGERLLRPLLGVAHARLEAMLRTSGQPWIEDPSNRDDRFERIVTRTALARYARRGWPAARLVGLAADHGAARRVEEGRLSALLGAAVRVDPAGFATIDPAAWTTVESALRAQALGRVLTVIGGLAFPPAAASCHRLAQAIEDARRSTTLGGCVIRPWRGTILIAREARAARDVVPLGQQPVMWDGRFAIEATTAVPDGLVVRRLGPDGAAQLRHAAHPAAHPAAKTWPAVVRWSLPALWRLDEVRAVPHLGVNLLGTGLRELVRLRFQPRQMLLAPHLARPGEAFRHGGAC
ncbi:MAG: tRNA lysidine(34) synthetase TilS [Alphaproteobacteria bacterium]